MVLTFKVIQAKSPEYLFNMFNNTYNYKTREADRGKIRHTRKPNLELAKDSFRWRAAGLYNQLPEHVRSKKSIESFKVAAKQWVRQKIELS